MAAVAAAAGLEVLPPLLISFRTGGCWKSFTL